MFGSEDMQGWKFPGFPEKEEGRASDGLSLDWGWKEGGAVAEGEGKTWSPGPGQTVGKSLG